MDRGDVPSLYEADCVAPATITFTPSSELRLLRIKDLKAFVAKFQISWEGHKIWKICAFFWNYLLFSKQSDDFFQFFVALSEYLNFNLVKLAKPRSLHWSSSIVRSHKIWKGKLVKFNKRHYLLNSPTSKPSKIFFQICVSFSEYMHFKGF